MKKTTKTAPKVVKDPLSIIDTIFATRARQKNDG